MVVFPTRADARAFTAHISETKAKYQWASPRPNDGPFAINFKTERTLPDQERGRAPPAPWRPPPTPVEWGSIRRRGGVAVERKRTFWASRPSPGNSRTAHATAQGGRKNGTRSEAEPRR